MSGSRFLCSFDVFNELPPSARKVVVSGCACGEVRLNTIIINPPISIRTLHLASLVQTALIGSNKAGTQETDNFIGLERKTLTTHSFD